MLCADSLWPWLGPPLAALRLCTSGFIEDVTFGRMALRGRPDVLVAVSYMRDMGGV